LYASSCASGVRDAHSIATSWWAKWITAPSKLSAQNEQIGQPSTHRGPNMKW
jgi:hypothetical protein